MGSLQRKKHNQYRIFFISSLFMLISYYSYEMLAGLRKMRAAILFLTGGEFIFCAMGFRMRKNKFFFLQTCSPQELEVGPSPSL